MIDTCIGSHVTFIIGTEASMRRGISRFLRGEILVWAINIMSCCFGSVIWLDILYFSTLLCFNGHMLFLLYPSLIISPNYMHMKMENAYDDSLQLKICECHTFSGKFQRHSTQYDIIWLQFTGREIAGREIAGIFWEGNSREGNSREGKSPEGNSREENIRGQIAGGK
jgi:hypothetical protein